MWLLALCLFFGPAGVGTSSALAAAMPDDCDPGCCDEVQEAHEDEAHDDCEGEEEELHADDSEPCEDACPDSCHECSCCFSVAVELDCIPQVGSARVSNCSGTSPPHAAPASRSEGSVFRPPRSLT
jgi:hypothetical protein